MKGFRHKPSENNKESVNWNKIVIGGACVLFAIVMVVSGMGMGWLNIFKDAKPGNTAVVDFTVLDDTGRAVVTTNNNIFQQALENGQVVFKADKMVVPVNISTNQELVPVPVYHPNLATLIDFGLFGTEIDAIRYGIEGMKVNEDRTIINTGGKNLVRTMSQDEFVNIVGEPFADAEVGEQVPMSFSFTPQIAVDNATPISYFRTAYVLSRDDDGSVTISYGYPTISVQLYQLSNN